MSWYFNSDYESYLFSHSGDESYLFKSSKINQEFEYLISFFEEEPIYTLKEYDQEFIRTIERLSGKPFLTTKNFQGAKPWWSPIHEPATDRMLHSKKTSSHFAISSGMDKESVIVNESSFQPSEKYLFKQEGELSGRGHLLWPKHKEKIERLIKSGAQLIQEPYRKRVMDFSSLILGEDAVIQYENIVDDKFQYKGTLISGDSFLNDLGDRKERYLSDILRIKSHYRSLGAEFPFSIDGYLYEEDGEQKICSMCEVNTRKTMGYIAYHLAGLLKRKHFAMLVRPSALDYFEEGIHCLRPKNSRFQILLIGAEDRQELKSIVDRVCRVS